MAEHLARRLLPEGTLIDSAGTHSWATEAAADTVAVMRTLYEIDISGHRPKSLSTVPVDIYDRIVALSPGVADFIRANYPQVAEKVICWDIDDPYQLGRGAFERCARQIERHVQNKVR